MTTKTISGTYTATYDLAAPTTTLRITPSGYLGGGLLAAGLGRYSVINQGGIRGSNYGVDLAGGGTVINTGAIWATGATGVGVYLEDGGAVTNGSRGDTTALISGFTGVSVAGAAGTVTNDGTIAGAATQWGFGVELHGGGVMTNGAGALTTALIQGYAGVVLIGMSTASNFGTIRGSDDNFGVGAFLSGYLAPGLGSLTNGSATDTTALIVGHVGATVETDDTLTNFGTVSGTGGFAVSLATATSRLNAEAGSVFEGKILIEGGLADFVGGVSTVSGLETVLGGTIKGAGTVSLDGDVSEFGPGTRLPVAGVIVSGAATQVNVYTDLTYAKLWAQTAGTLAVGAGHRMTFTGANDIFSGTLTGAGTVAFTRGSDTLDILTLSAASLVIDTARVTLQGVIVLTTSLIATTANLIVAASGATLSGGGRLTLSDNATNRLLGASVTATLTNVNDTIAGVGRLGGGTMILVNQAGGVIDGDATLGLVIDTGANTIANAGTIEATGAGGLTIAGAVANTGVLAATVGTLTVNGAVTGAGKVLIDGGTADFTSTFNQKVRFVTGAAGVLELARSRIYTGAIVGFSRTGDTSLDLADIAFGGSTRVSYSGTTTSGVLTVTDGTHSAHIKLRGDYTASTFNVSSDGHGGTTLVDPTRSPPHVFIAAMAGMGASGAGGAIGARPDVERSGLAMLARPGFAPA